MQKISNLVLLTACMIVAGLPVTSQPVPDQTVQGAQLQICFDESERLARLKCYDDLLERPRTVEEAAKPQETDAVERVAQLPKAIEYANSLLFGKNLVEETVSVSLRPVEESSAELPEGVGEDGILGFLKSPFTDEDLKALRGSYDLFLAIASDETIGEAATLLLSCENNISRLKIVFSEPFEGRFVDARFYGSENLTDDAGLHRKLWVRGEGYLLENARGLDAIKLMGRIVAGARSQISVGNGEAVRSAFFETDALRDALPLLAQHCSWSSGLEN